VARASTGQAWLQKNEIQERRPGARREKIFLCESLVMEIKHVKVAPVGLAGQI
jgi:hypothetical protein